MRRFAWMRLILSAVGMSHAVFLAGTLWRNSGWFCSVVRRFETTEREVWLTIDDGPDPQDTPRILDLLDRFSAKATFFSIGRKVACHRGLSWQTVAREHEVANHTYSHPHGMFWTLPPQMIDREIEWGARAIHEATGQWPRFFRSPVGMTNPFVRPALRRCRHQLIGWSVSGLDGLGERGAKVAARIESGLRPGAIVVLHESGAPGRIETLEMVLSRIETAGYRCVLPSIQDLRS